MFQPTIDTVLTISLPGESLRAPVTKVIDANTVFVVLDAAPLNPAKSHSYRKDDMIACRRKRTVLGEEWVAFDDRVLYARPATVVEPPLPKKERYHRKVVAKRKTAAKKTAKRKR